MIKVITVQFVI